MNGFPLNFVSQVPRDQIFEFNLILENSTLSIAEQMLLCSECLHSLPHSNA